ncbi:SURF1 family cytochrome oxidase biogenesis protein, partial [Corynebacterium sphenisci]|uniref:SURF1 family cytochrome oxidase biogenesis protein n=1 Tax=Corynebacterium sphenisci TaxID=191493 RepID=UPI0026DF73EC
MGSRLRQFLTPGWVLAAVVAIAFAYLAFTVLAPWQLGKNTATQERNHQLREAFETDPAPAAEVFDPAGRLPEGAEWRRVELTGRYQVAQQAQLRNRPVESVPAVQVLTVFRTGDGRAFLVNRGWVPPAEGRTPDIEPAPDGEVTIRGYARRGERTPERPPIVDADAVQVYGIDTAQIGGLIGAEVAPDWVQLAEEQPGGLNPIPLPQLESGPYLSYGIQWIFFGFAAPLTVLWFVYAEVRERRREREEQAEHEAALAAARRGAAGPAPRPGAGYSAADATTARRTAGPDATAAPADTADSADPPAAPPPARDGGAPG